jgi:signal transduction histidine kinase
VTSRAEAYYRVALPSGGTGLAYVYGTPYPEHARQPGMWGIPLTVLIVLIAGALAFIGTLGGLAWFVGPAVLRPLAAMGQAAQAIAAGNLDVTLPPSRVREVADVSAAFAAMGSALRASIEREAELEQERRLFVGAIAHDLRTPLFSLRGFLQGLEQGLASTPERAKRYVAVCQDKAAVLDRLIADLFAYARAEHLQEVPRREQLDLGGLLAKTADGLRPLVETKEVVLDLSGPSPCPLTGDAHLLVRAIDNLLDNAIRHTPPGGSIAVGWRREADRVLITVTDSGPGIAPHDLPHLFTPLYRAETSRNRQTGGAGLGLTVARRILQAHGGDLSAANGAAGGAIFTAVLPVETAGPAPLRTTSQQVVALAAT